MTLADFIQEKDVEFCKNLLQKDKVKEIEKTIGFEFGVQLKAYIVEYGYLAYDDVELYGINSKQFLDSDMVKQTLYLNKYFPKTKGFVALENRGDGDYYLVDNNDNVFEYISENDKLIDQEEKLFDYILKRFCK